MAIKIDNVTYRNLQEQVQKNKSDIAAFKSIQFTLNNMGITVLGRVDNYEDIPSEKHYEYGDAYLVGLEEPYDIYIFTRDDEDGSFINMGPLAIVGPEGPEGKQGEKGEQGERGSKIFTGQASPASLPTTNYIEDDVYIRLTALSSVSYNGDIYQYKDLTWTKVGNIKGAKGDQGEQGNSPYIENSYWYIDGVNTNVKAKGEDGKDGKDGKDGLVFNVLGELASTTLLPDPSTKDEYDAYLVGNNTDGYVLYVVIDGAWKKITFSTGSQLYDGENSLNVYDIKKLKPRTIQFYSPTEVFKDDDIGGYAVIGSGLYETQDQETSYELEATAVVLPLQDSDEIVFNANNNKIEAHLANEVTNKIAKSLVTPNTAPTKTKVVAIDTANAQTLINIDDFAVSNSANLITSGGVVNAIKNSTKGTIQKIKSLTINSTDKVTVLNGYSQSKDAFSAILIRVGYPYMYNANWSTTIPMDAFNTQLTTQGMVRIRPVIGNAFSDSSTTFWGLVACELGLQLDSSGNDMLQIYPTTSNIFQASFKSTSIASSRYNWGSASIDVEIYGIMK